MGGAARGIFGFAEDGRMSRGGGAKCFLDGRADIGCAKIVIRRSIHSDFMARRRKLIAHLDTSVLWVLTNPDMDSWLRQKCNELLYRYIIKISHAAVGELFAVSLIKEGIAGLWRRFEMFIELCRKLNLGRSSFPATSDEAMELALDLGRRIANLSDTDALIAAIAILDADADAILTTDAVMQDGQITQYARARFHDKKRNKGLSVPKTNLIPD